MHACAKLSANGMKYSRLLRTADGNNNGLTRKNDKSRTECDENKRKAPVRVGEV
ncbi:hypothetical protein GCM10009069_29580 [Algimonas arctica]|uniref:Uncharacterized protein n=1 Tax=Algimonas arctica TaxID=1479486 RepID=A0A8J3CUZ2_9PROT|nr:hypothetical protein GCM10009069_29580 [Algimonas arctica]